MIFEVAIVVSNEKNIFHIYISACARLCVFIVLVISLSIQHNLLKLSNHLCYEKYPCTVTQTILSECCKCYFWDLNSNYKKVSGGKNPTSFPFVLKYPLPQLLQSLDNQIQMKILTCFSTPKAGLSVSRMMLDRGNTFASFCF